MLNAAKHLGFVRLRPLRITQGKLFTSFRVTTPATLTQPHLY